jgi:hypothetical protein
MEAGRLSAPDTRHRLVAPASYGPDSIRSHPVGNGSEQAYAGEYVSGEFVVARGDAPEILEPSDAALDDIAALVGFLVITDALLAIARPGSAYRSAETAA